MEEPVIDILVVEPDRPEHIARHGITLDEITEVLGGSYAFLKGKLDRWRLIGKTQQGRLLTIIIGQRAQENVYGLVTARPARDAEREFYMRLYKEQGGEEDERKAS